MEMPRQSEQMERFVVVDDDEDIVIALKKLLESMGYRVAPFVNPLEAVKENDFDLVLTDFNMPYLNGVELLGKMREKKPEAVRLLLTAANDFKIAMDAVNRGEVFRLLPKPWRLDEFRSSIQQAVGYYRLVQENRRLNGELARRNLQLTDLNATLEKQVVERTNGLLEGMVRALDYRDTETQWHSWRVAKFTRKIAEATGISGAELEYIEQGALLHDIGKIGVRDSILLKPGPLTPDEWVEMKQHPEIGWRMLANIPYLQDAAEIVYQHQERYDGKGYPRGLKGKDIVVGARIFVLADTMDAITSDRPYRKGSPLETALTEIGRLAGTQFDPDLAKVFLNIPASVWIDIRNEISHMEAKDKARWQDRPLLTPARVLAAKDVVLPPAPAPKP